MLIKGSLIIWVTNSMLSSSSTQITPLRRRDALCWISSVNAPARRIALRVSCRAPESSAGLPEYLTMSPASVLTVMTRCWASPCAVEIVVLELMALRPVSDEPLPRANACASRTVQAGAGPGLLRQLLSLPEKES